MPWFNREVLGSDSDEFPIDRRVGIAVNVGLGWGGELLAALAGRRAPALAAWVAAMNLGNAAVHLGAFARERRYRPGVATATVLLAPLAVGALAALTRDDDVPGAAVAAGAAVGALMGVGGFVTLRRRARARPR